MAFQISCRCFPVFQIVFSKVGKLLSILGATKLYSTFETTAVLFSCQSTGPNSFEKESYSHRKRTKAAVVEEINPITTKKQKILGTSPGHIPQVCHFQIHLSSAQQPQKVWNRLNALYCESIKSEKKITVGSTVCQIKTNNVVQLCLPYSDPYMINCLGMNIHGKQIVCCVLPVVPTR